MDALIVETPPEGGSVDPATEAVPPYTECHRQLRGFWPAAPTEYEGLAPQKKDGRAQESSLLRAPLS